MIDHISLGVSDLAKSIAFYDAVLLPLGIHRLWTTADAAGYGYAGVDEPFSIRQASSDETQVVGSEMHLAFTAPSRSTIEAFHRAAIEHGGIDNGSPQTHTEYGPGYFAAFVLDPDRHRIEAVLHEVS